MKNSIPSVQIAITLAGLLVVPHSFAGDKANPTASQKLDPKLQELMKKTEAESQPGAGHKALEPLVGTWSASVRCWMEPGAEPTVSSGKARVTWILEGRFLLEDFQGEFLGQPFQGMSITGYDNAKQQYNSVWLDDMHTSMFVSHGEAGTGSRLFTFAGKMDCPRTGEKDKLMKQVIRVISPDKHIFEMHDPSLGDKSKIMEITYTRNK
jgi:hypothetical protein